MFLGTPHQGGQGLDSATTVAKFLYPQYPARAELVQPLDPKSLFLFDQTDDFRQFLEAKRVKIYTFHETEKTVSYRDPFKPPFLVRYTPLGRDPGSSC